MLKQTLIHILSPAINRYLALDPESPLHLKKLNGRQIGIHLRPFQMTIYAIITDEKIHLTTIQPEKTNVTISGSPLQLAAALMTSNNRHQFFADDVQIEGNIELGQQIIELFDHLQIDWEEQLSHFTGDAAAYHIGSTIKKFTGWLKNANQSLTANLSDYLHEEVNLLPTREALADFYNDIDALRMDTDRIEASVKH